jgi:hypothetical protein
MQTATVPMFITSAVPSSSITSLRVIVLRWTGPTGVAVLRWTGPTGVTALRWTGPTGVTALRWNGRTGLSPKVVKF